MTEANRAALADMLPTFELTLRHGARLVDRGIGANVLDSPALALVHLARVSSPSNRRRRRWRPARS